MGGIPISAGVAPVGGDDECGSVRFENSPQFIKELDALGSGKVLDEMTRSDFCHGSVGIRNTLPNIVNVLLTEIDCVDSCPAFRRSLSAANIESNRRCAHRLILTAR